MRRLARTMAQARLLAELWMAAPTHRVAVATAERHLIIGLDDRMPALSVWNRVEAAVGSIKQPHCQKGVAG